MFVCIYVLSVCVHMHVCVCVIYVGVFVLPV